MNRYSLIPEECLLINDDDTNKTLEVAMCPLAELVPTHMKNLFNWLNKS